MFQAHMDERSAVPWWAAFGAPLFGVPLLVGLLALGGGGHGGAGSAAPAEAAEAGYATEQVESVTVHMTVALPIDVDDAIVMSRC